MMTIPDVFGEPLGACPACGDMSWKDAGQAKDYSITGEWFELKECGTCHLRATHPKPKESEIGRYYASQDYISHSDTRKGLINKLYHRVRGFMLQKKHRWVTRFSGRDKGLLLDIGAGTGHFAHYMKSKGWEVLALEPDETARKVASEKLGLDIQPLESLARLPGHTYDVITLWHVLEHVHDLSGYMDQFRSILKPDGTLIIAVPNYTSWDAARYGPQWAAYDVPRHLWHFSPLSMEKLCNKHGFTLLEKIPMDLDAFYVSLLSEKYKGNGVFGLLGALISGCKTFLASRKVKEKASSLIYVIKP